MIRDASAPNPVFAELKTVVAAVAERIAINDDVEDVLQRAERALSTKARGYAVRSYLLDQARSELRKNTAAAEAAAAHPQKLSNHFLADPRGAAAPLFEGRWQHGHVASGIKGRYRSAAFNGCECQFCAEYFEYCEKLDASSSALEAGASNSVLAAINDYAAGLHMKWTAELLTSRFALHDGRLVTWGQATAEEHQERVGMFRANAVANIEGAARHLAAIEVLSAAEKLCLNDLVAEAAA